MRRKGLLAILLVISIASGMLSRFLVQQVSPVDESTQGTSEPADVDSLDLQLVEPPETEVATDIDYGTNPDAESSEFQEFPAVAPATIDSVTDGLTSDPQSTEPADVPVESPDSSTDTTEVAGIDTSFAAPPASVERVRIPIANPPAEAEAINVADSADISAADDAELASLDTPEVPLTGGDDSADRLALWQDIVSATSLTLIGAALLVAVIRWVFRELLA